MGFIDSIVNFFGGIGSVLADLLAVAEWLFNIILYVAQVLLQFIVAVGNFLLSVIAQVGKFLVHVWQNFFKGIFSRVLSVLQKAHDWLEQHLRPIINFLKRVRAYYDRIFLTYIKPLLATIQHIRQFLQLLRLLHINIAVKLDAILAQVEGRIAQTFLTIRATLNNAIDLLNVLADPTNLLRKPTLLLSIRRTLPALIRVVTGRPPGYYFPSPRGAAGKSFAPVPFNFAAGDPAMNPPASSYMGTDDGIENTQPLDIGFTISTTVVDDADVLDYFDDSLWPDSVCTDPAACLTKAVLKMGER